MNHLRLDKDNYLTWRFAPWDEKVFGFQTLEVLTINYAALEALKNLMHMLDAFNISNGITLCYTRIDAQDRLAKYVLQEDSFYYAETSLSIIKKSFPLSEPSLRGRSLPLQEPSDADFAQMKAMAKNDFSHGRFHEDYHISDEQSRIRYYNWIDDLREQGKEFLVYKNLSEVVGFHVQSVDGDKCEMILTGTKSEKSMVSYFFWSAILENLEKRGVREVKTLISAANIPIVNLYGFFGFKIEKTLIGLHKIYGDGINGQ